ncbi:hypothetical protein EV560_111108 [Bosea sp. BK604]|nr:hypothetical protein EV560_111108 [Bosea sp. BK604]
MVRDSRIARARTIGALARRRSPRTLPIHRHPDESSAGPLFSMAPTRVRKSRRRCCATILLLLRQLYESNRRPRLACLALGIRPPTLCRPKRTGGTLYGTSVIPAGPVCPFSRLHSRSNRRQGRSGGSCPGRRHAREGRGPAREERSPDIAGRHAARIQPVSSSTQAHCLRLAAKPLGPSRARMPDHVVLTPGPSRTSSDPVLPQVKVATPPLAGRRFCSRSQRLDHRSGYRLQADDPATCLRIGFSENRNPLFGPMR